MVQRSKWRSHVQAVGSVTHRATWRSLLVILYIDPGAGSLLIQALIAAAVSVPFFFRNAIRNTVRKFRGEAQPVREADLQADPEEE